MSRRRATMRAWTLTRLGASGGWIEQCIGRIEFDERADLGQPQEEVDFGGCREVLGEPNFVEEAPSDHD